MPNITVQWYAGRTDQQKREIVAAITSRERGLPFHILIGTDSGLRTPSWAQSESVRAISVQRVIKRLGRASPGTVAEVRNRITNFLGDW